MSRLVMMFGLVLGIFVFLTVAMTQWSLMSFANMDAVEYLWGVFVKIKSISDDFSGHFRFGLVGLSTI